MHIYTNLFKQKWRNKQKTKQKRTFGDDNYGWTLMRARACERQRETERERKIKSQNLKGTDRSWEADIIGKSTPSPSTKQTKKQNKKEGWNKTPKTGDSFLCTFFQSPVKLVCLLLKTVYSAHTHTHTHTHTGQHYTLNPRPPVCVVSFSFNIVVSHFKLKNKFQPTPCLHFHEMFDNFKHTDWNTDDRWWERRSQRERERDRVIQFLSVICPH